MPPSFNVIRINVKLKDHVSNSKWLFSYLGICEGALTAGDPALKVAGEPLTAGPDVDAGTVEVTGQRRKLTLIV